jgi:hypothetical protein
LTTDNIELNLRSDIDDNAPIKRGRNRWVAAVLSLCLGGLGHLYLGQRRFAWLIPAFYVGAYTSLSLAGALNLVPALLIGTGLVTLSMIVRFSATIHAFQNAQKAGAAPRWWHYVLFVLVVFNGLPFGVSLNRRYILEPYSTNGDALAPTLTNGDFTLISKLPPRAPLGSIVLYTVMKDGVPYDYLSRVTALAGEEADGHIVPIGHVHVDPGEKSAPILRGDIEEIAIKGHVVSCWFSFGNGKNAEDGDAKKIQWDHIRSL